MKMICRLIPLLFIAAAATAPAAEPSSVLQRAEQRLKPLLAGLGPAPIIEHPENTESLIVLYRPQKFLVHGHNMRGEYSTNVSEHIGPGFKGFVLKIHRQSLGEINQAVAPQTLREPYWQTLLDVTPVAGTTNQIYWALSYAGSTDQELLERVKKALGSLAGNETQRRTEPEGSANGSQPLRSATNRTPSSAGSRR